MENTEHSHGGLRGWQWGGLRGRLPFLKGPRSLDIGELCSTVVGGSLEEWLASQELLYRL